MDALAMLGLCWYCRVGENYTDNIKRFKNYSRIPTIDEIRMSQVDIFHACIKSHYSIPFSQARIRICFDEGTSSRTIDNTLEILDRLQGNKTIILSRPSTLKEWCDESELVIDTLGAKQPIVFHYNHDHAYIGETQGFNVSQLDLMARTFSDYSNWVIHPTHYPETITTFDPIYQGNWMREHGFHDRWPLPVQNVTIGDRTWKAIESCMGMEGKGGFPFVSEYISNSLFNNRMWSSLYKFQSTDPSYVPRPEWSGVLSEPPIDCQHFCPPGEIFAHYDGYGHVTSLIDYIQPLSLDSNGRVTDPTSNIPVQSQIFKEVIQRFKRCYYLLIARRMRLILKHPQGIDLCKQLVPSYINEIASGYVSEIISFGEPAPPPNNADTKLQTDIMDSAITSETYRDLQVLLADAHFVRP